MRQGIFRVEINIEAEDWTKHSYEIAFTPYSEPGIEDNLLYLKGSQIQRQMTLTTQGERSWVLFQITVDDLVEKVKKPLKIYVSVFCNDTLKHSYVLDYEKEYNNEEGAQIFEA